MERREFPRYKVFDLKRLSGKMETMAGSDKILVTFGKGGCGFFAQETSPAIEPVKRVYCRFILEPVNSNQPPVTLEVQGHVIYAKRVQMEGKGFIYYGVKFLESHRPIVDPIVKELDSLAADGRLEYAETA